MIVDGYISRSISEYSQGKIENTKKEVDSHVTLDLNTDTMHKSLVIAKSNPRMLPLHRGRSIQQPVACAAIRSRSVF